MAIRRFLVATIRKIFSGLQHTLRLLSEEVTNACFEHKCLW